MSKPKSNPKKHRLQVDISEQHLVKLNKLCGGRRIQGAVVEALIDMGSQAKYSPFKR